MLKQSQRDSRWANIKLGTSQVTIGGYGCLITCIANYLNITPLEVNQRLLAVNGYAEGNLVIWAKIEEAFPGIKVRRVWSYNNDDVKANVPNVIVQVNGAPIGGTIHFVNYIGGGRLIDPWDGTEKATSTYEAQSYAVFTGSWVRPVDGDYYKGLDLTNKDSMKIAVDAWAKMVAGDLVDKSKLVELEKKIEVLNARKTYEPEVDEIVTILKRVGKAK